MKIPGALRICLAMLIGVLGGGSVLGGTITIPGPRQITFLDRARPGDIATLKNGNWMDVKIVVSKGGTAAKPLTIRAESPGGVVLGGSSSLEINPPYVIVDGLFFSKGALSGGAVIHFNSQHGIVRNTAIVDYNPASFQTGYYWVFFEGDDNLVERCFFKGKNHLEPLIGNAESGSRRNAVTHSCFKDVPFADANGREIIRVWGAGKFDERNDDGAFFTIADNVFDHADGEGTEIISLKSNHNQVLRNTILATRGGITIRRGNDNLVKGNIVLGAGLAGAEGLRISGERNVVQGNYVSGCEYGIRIACGEFTGGDLTGSYVPDVKRKAKKAIATYPQVRELTLSDNVVVGVAGADLEIGFAYKKHWPQSQQVLLPENCVIQNNRFVRTKSGDSVIGTVPDTAPPLDRFTFQPNRYAGNVLVGGRNTFAPSASGFVAQTIPAGWSEAQEAAKLKPLLISAADVGPDWMRAARSSTAFPARLEPSKKIP